MGKPSWGMSQGWAELWNETVSSLILYLPSVSLEGGLFPGLSPAIPEEALLLFEFCNGKLSHRQCPGKPTTSTFKLFGPQIWGGGASGMNAVLGTN